MVNETCQAVLPQAGSTGAWMTNVSPEPPDVPGMGDGEVHVWRLPLDQPGLLLDEFLAYLAPDELSRSQRYVFNRDRQHFVVARGFLRAILAQYTGCAPSAVQLGYGVNGKPFLDGASAASGLSFNLSHTHRLGLCALALGRQVGVDVERIRPVVDILGIARSTFSPGERTRLEALPPDLQLAAFYACWTRKEAYIKARGDGLSYPLDAFDVSLEPGEPVVLLRSADDPAELGRWSLHDIDVGEGYSAALAVERPVTRLCLIDHQAIQRS